MIELFRFSSQDHWVKALADRFVNLAQHTVRMRGEAHVALAGGSTPRPFYERLSRHPKISRLKVHWWLSDERWVPVLDSASNERMIREAWGANLQSFLSHFHSPRLASQPVQAAEEYAVHIQKAMGVRPAFDLILLGLGEDGHTASLFPGTSALDEIHKLVVANQVPQSQEAPVRLTFTFPLLNQAREIWFLVRGKTKKQRVAQLLARDPSIPVSKILVRNQKVFWLT